MATRNGTPKRRTPRQSPPRPAARAPHRRVRLVGAVVQLELVTDDGTTLEPLPTNPLNVPAGDWPPDLPALLADFEQRLNSDPPAAAEETENVPE